MQYDEEAPKMSSELELLLSTFLNLQTNLFLSE